MGIAARIYFLNEHPDVVTRCGLMGIAARIYMLVDGVEMALSTTTWTLEDLVFSGPSLTVTLSATDESSNQANVTLQLTR